MNALNIQNAGDVIFECEDGHRDLISNGGFCCCCGAEYISGTVTVLLSIAGVSDAASVTTFDFDLR